MPILNSPFKVDKAEYKADLKGFFQINEFFLIQLKNCEDKVQLVIVLIL